MILKKYLEDLFIMINSIRRVLITIRSIFFFTVIGINTLVVGGFIFLAFPFNPSSQFILKWGRWFCRLNFWESTCKLRLLGTENLPPPEQAAVYVSNHQGYFDILTIFGFIPRDLVMVSKAVIFKIPVFGWAMRKTGFVSVNRSSAKSRKEVVDAAVNRIENNLSVHFFPEGTRTGDGTINRFKPGAFKVAQIAGVPVIPLMICGSFEVLRKKDFQIYPGLITLHILPPVMVAPNSESTTVQTAEEVREKIEQAYEAEKEQRDQGLC
jgi:1-acyl-sn-glycerol-3-phosphate acyltransferase